MQIVFEYINYRWKAKGRHGIHSPFVYDFVDKCLNIKINESDKLSLSNYYSELKKDQRKIEITDFGAGSKKLSNIRSVHQIFNISSSKGKFGELFYKISRHYKPSTVLELGTSLGIGTLNFALGNPESRVITIEGCHGTAAIARETFQKFNLDKVNLFEGRFDEILDNLPLQTFDLIFIDGHHDGNATLNYLKKLNPFISSDTIIILDDIRWSESMFEAWNKLTQDKTYHLSMDLFRMGILSKRPQQEKQHFVINY